MRCGSYSTVWPIAPTESKADESQRLSTPAKGSRLMPATTSSGALIDVRAISKAFQSESHVVTALRDVSFSVAKEEFVSFLGPSGCGKTTLMMILVGLTRADSGETRIEGRRIAAPFTDVGIVFQNPELLDWRTALENILLQIEIRRMPVGKFSGRARELLAQVGLVGFENRYP